MQCLMCNDKGHVTAVNPTTGDTHRYECNHNGTITVPMALTQQHDLAVKVMRYETAAQQASAVYRDAARYRFICESELFFVGEWATEDHARAGEGPYDAYGDKDDVDAVIDAAMSAAARQD